MTDTSSPPVWRRRIATEMKRLRQSSGKSQANVAEYLGCAVPKISLMESGQRLIREDDLNKLFDLYEVGSTDRDYYLTAAKKARLKGWWERNYPEEVINEPFKKFIGLEQGAHQQRAYSSNVFHGLLQTPAYATELFESRPAPVGDEVIRRRVAVRMKRQEAISREVDPLRLTVVVDESTLHRVIGGPEIMRPQLAHVADVVRRNRSVSVRVMPFERGYLGNHDFSIFSFSWPNDPGVVHIEHNSSVFLESLAEIDSYVQRFKRYTSLALSEEESIEMIEKKAAEYSSAAT